MSEYKNSDAIDSEDDSSDDDVSYKGLNKRYDSESEDEKNTYLLRNTRSVRNETSARKTRASIMFSLKDKNGNTKENLELLDIGSTGGLIRNDLVKEYGI